MKYNLLVHYSKITILLLTCLVSGLALANPVLNNIGAGQVSISQQPNSTVINQSSSKAIINWRSFNIGSEESTHFQQPAGGVTLNRIDATQGVSQIYGRLSSTGRIILVNPAGFYFGPHAFVNVGGIIATTSAMSDQNFINDKYEFNASGGNGAIVNEGTIVARDNGLVALVAPGVINKGVITANVGKVVLASGEAFTMDFAGDQLINFTISKETTKRAVDKDGNELPDGVSNKGTVIADGGKILVTAKSARGVLDNVINIDGVMQAKSVAKVNGEIILGGDTRGGVVKVSGKLIATSDRYSGKRGGKVIVTGHQILVTKHASIDVSGDVGGGDINIGGSYQGKGPLPNASAVVMEPGAVLLADAQTHGNGGNIILWADDVTKVYGNLSARGGSLDGNGGFIETSAKNYLEVGNILVDTNAPNGKLGTWLLDPRNIDITASTNFGMSTSGGDPNTYTATADNAQVSAATIIANLATANVIITTGSTGSQSGDINVNAPINWSSSNSLTLMANRNIKLNAAITNTTSGAAVLNLIANSAGNFGLNDNGTVTYASGNINVIGTTNIYYNPVAYTTPTSFAPTGGTLRSFMYINNAANLQTVSGNSGLWSNNFALSNNINASSLVGFTPIGTTATPYAGLFDGLNHDISNLTINVNVIAGLFGVMSGSIQNLGLTNVSVTTTNTSAFIGGLVGEMIGTGFINNSYSIGTISSSTIPFGAGGLVGGMEGTNNTITNSYSGGTVNASTVTNTGGLVGHMIAGAGNSISNSYSTATVSGAGNVGGLVGFQGPSTTITNSYTSGNVSGINAVGGLVGGSLGGIITNSYALGNISGTVSQVGGLVGFCAFCSIATSYSTGTATAPATAGGLVGERSSATVTNSYWDTQTSGKANGVGIGGGPTTGITGLTTIQFKTLASFIGFTITSTVSTTSTKPSGVWFIFAGQTRPMLLSEWSTSVANAHQLQLIGSTLGASYTLTKDISLVSGMTNAAEIWGTNSLSGAGFAPIGTFAQGYKGTLNGASHNIDGLYINTTSAITSNIGLIGAIGNVGRVQDLALTNINIVNASGSFNIAGIAGVNLGTITNVSITGSINAGAASTDVAGIAGINSGTISNSTNAANILSGTGSMGGVAGYNNGTITNSSNTGTITISGTTGGNGGLAGWNDVGGSILNSYNTGNITVSNSQKWIGGFVGINNGSIQNSYNSANVTVGTTSLDVGSFVGLVGSTGSISNSYSTGNVSVGASSTHVGGFIGGNLGTINRSFNLGTVTGVSGTNIGGFVGINQTGSINDSYSMSPVSGGTISNVAGFAAQNQATLSRVYSIGYVNGVNGSVGGLVGANTGTVTNSFWNTETSGRLTSGGGTGRTTAQMFQQSNYTGWTFPSTWNIINGQSYPYLTAFYPSTPRAISGLSPVAAGGALTLVSNNTATTGFTDIAYAGANGGYYFLEGTTALPTIFTVNHSISDGGLFMIYANGTIKANTIGKVPSSNGSLNNIDMGAQNTLKLVGSSSISNTDIGTISSGIAASNLLFSVSGNQLTLGNAFNPNVILSTASNTPYVIDGNVTTFGGGSSSALFNGPVTINTTNFTTTGSQQYYGAVTLGSDTTLTTTNSDIIFTSTLNSATTGRNLTLNAGSGNITLATTGNLLALNTITLNSTSTTTLGGNVTAASLTTNSGGSTVIGGSAISTTGNQTYNEAVTLAASTSITGAVLTFAQPISGAFNLAMLGTSIVLNGGSVNTASGTQTYTGPLSFGGDTTFTGSALTFNSSINTPVNLIFNGTTYLNGSAYNTNANNQTYNGAIILGANTVLSGNTLTLNNAVSGNHNFGLTGTNLIVNGGSISTGTGSQTYNGTFTFGTDTNFTGGTLTFNNAINTNANLLIAGSNIVLNGGTYNTNAASQTYSGIITLGVDTLLSGSTISLTGSLNGNHDFTLTGTTLILNTSNINTGGGNQTYTGNMIFGSNMNFTGGVLTFNNSINTNVNLAFAGSNIILNSNSYNTNNGTQTYTGPLTLTADTTLTGSEIMIGSGVSGNQELNLIGHILSVNGNLSLTNLTATGNGSNNIFTLNNPNNEAFILNGAYSGTLTFGSTPGTFTNIQTINAGTGNNVLTGLSAPSAWELTTNYGGNITGSIAFTRIQSLIAGDFDDSFHFNSGSSITSIVAGGGSNTLDFRNSGNTPINVFLGSNIFQGSVDNYVNQYTSINNLIGNQPTFNLIRLPNKVNSLVVTGARQGYIGDPLTFQYFDNVTSVSGHDTIRFTSPPLIVSVQDSTAVVDGSLMYFPGFNLGTSPNINPTIPGILEPGNKPHTDSPVVPRNNIDGDINSILEEIDREFDNYWDNLKINMHCGLETSKEKRTKCKISNQLIIESSLTSI